MILDQATLFAVAISITGLLGVFLLLLWRQERGMGALAWWGAAYLVGACAVALWGASAIIPPDLPNAVLFIACGMIWNGARAFHGRAVQRCGLFAGAAAWCIAMQFPNFVESGQARLALSSVVIALYAFLAAFELDTGRAVERPRSGLLEHAFARIRPRHSSTSPRHRDAIRACHPQQLL